MDMVCGARSWKESGKQEKRKNLLRSSFPNSFCLMRQLLLATRNPHKTREFSQILGAEFVVCDLSTEADAPTIEETGSTFAENAILKAVGISKQFPGLVVADDSGLEVDALDGAPGVYSARYAGPEAKDHGNIERLLAELRGCSLERPPSARFRCVLVLARDGELLDTFEGIVEGTIVDPPRGGAGFGYDPIFQPTGLAKTFAELSAVEKNQISHRANAIRLLRAVLRE
jgi:XTP/dITP diphosphohydrolase